MRNIWYCVAMSLDGFIAGPNGEYDWIPVEPEIDWGAFMNRFDTVLMGRRSYEASLTAPGGGAMPGMQSYVCSNTLQQQDHPKVTIISHNNLTAKLESLRKEDGKEIWLFGGGELFRSLLLLGQVDRTEVGLVPIMLGRGIRFLQGLDQITPLHLIDTRLYPSGIMMLTYQIANAKHNGSSSQ